MVMLSPEMMPEMEDRFEVFQNTSGIEGFEAAHLTNGEDLKKIYLSMEDKVMRSDGETVWIVITGPSGSHKTTVGMGLERLFQNSPALSAWAEKVGKELDIETYTFSNNAIVARQVGLIPPSEMNGSYSTESYRNMAVFQWEMMLRDAINIEKKMARVRIVEISAPTSFPVWKFEKAELHSRPVTVTGGPDRGLSLLATLAEDERTRNNTFIFATKRNTKVGERARDWREKLDSKSVDLHRILGDKTVVYYRRIDGSIVKAENFSEEVQRKLVEFLVLTVNPPEGINRSDKELETLFKRLAVNNISEYYDELAKQIGFTNEYGLENRFIKIGTELNLGEVGFNLNYFLNSSLPVKLYRPQSLIWLINALERIQP